MKLYAISGLGADERVFNYLKLDLELIPIPWITPQKNESIENYAMRLSKAIDTQEDFGILGLSFGGLITIEISKQLRPKFTILISSVETRSDFPYLIKTLGKLVPIRLLPLFLFDPPRKLAYYLFGTQQKKLLNDILDDTDLHFVKWAIRELLYWKNKTKLKQIIKIQGSKDRLLPPKVDQNTILIQDGGHFMIVDSAEQVSHVVNEYLKKII